MAYGAEVALEALDAREDLVLGLGRVGQALGLERVLGPGDLDEQLVVGALELDADERVVRVAREVAAHHELRLVLGPLHSECERPLGLVPGRWTSSLTSYASRAAVDVRETSDPASQPEGDGGQPDAPDAFATATV